MLWYIGDHLTKVYSSVIPIGQTKETLGRVLMAFATKTRKVIYYMHKQNSWVLPLMLKQRLRLYK